MFNLWKQTWRNAQSGQTKRTNRGAASNSDDDEEEDSGLRPSIPSLSSLLANGGISNSQENHEYLEGSRKHPRDEATVVEDPLPVTKKPKTDVVAKYEKKDSVAFYLPEILEGPTAPAAIGGDYDNTGLYLLPSQVDELAERGRRVNSEWFLSRPRRNLTCL